MKLADESVAKIALLPPTGNGIFLVFYAKVPEHN
jgi:hypothetical protein